MTLTDTTPAPSAETTREAAIGSLLGEEPAAPADTAETPEGAAAPEVAEGETDKPVETEVAVDDEAPAEEPNAPKVDGPSLEQVLQERDALKKQNDQLFDYLAKVKQTQPQAPQQPANQKPDPLEAFFNKHNVAADQRPKLREQYADQFNAQFESVFGMPVSELKRVVSLVDPLYSYTARNAVETERSTTLSQLKELGFAEGKMTAFFNFVQGEQKNGTTDGFPRLMERYFGRETLDSAQTKLKQNAAATQQKLAKQASASRDAGKRPPPAPAKPALGRLNEGQKRNAVIDEFLRELDSK